MTMIAMMIGLIAVAAAYTCYGGIRSGITTDVTQFVLIAIGLVSTLGLMLHILPVGEAVRVVSETKGEAGFNPLASENFGPVYVMWMIFVAGIVCSAVWADATHPRAVRKG
jgi:Na+/proline symporter